MIPLRKLAHLQEQLGEQLFAALIDPENTGKVRAFVKSLVTAHDGTVELELELTYVDGIVVELRDAGGPWGYCNGQINDENYPTQGEGTVTVKYRIVPGDLFKRDEDDWCYREDFKKFCEARGWREPNAAEALLPVARCKQLGNDGPLVAFVVGSPAAFVVYAGRELHQDVDDGHWATSFDFLAVCE